MAAGPLAVGTRVEIVSQAHIECAGADYPYYYLGEIGTVVVEEPRSGDTVEVKFDRQDLPRGRGSTGSTWYVGLCDLKVLEGLHRAVPGADEAFIEDVQAEVARARSAWPANADALPALMEEVGEHAQKMIQMKHEPHKGVTSADVYKEAVQVAVMAMRLATEGTDGFPYDPADVRK